MKKLFLSLLLCTGLISFFEASAQTEPEYQVFLRNGFINPKKNISEEAIRELNRKTLLPNRKSLVLIQFDEIPDDAEKARLKSEGIELLDYVPNKAFAAIIKGSLNSAAMKRSGARSIITLTPSQKMSTSLANGEIPAHAEKIAGVLEVWISFPQSLSFEEVKTSLDASQFKITSDVFKDYHILALAIDKNRLNELASLPVIKYVEPAPGENSPINDKAQVSSRANVLRSNAVGGYGILGKGVVVGVGDEANPMQHIDLTKRIINRAPLMAGVHGVHIMGIVGGAGIVNEKYKGYAPKATLVTQYYTGIFMNASTYVKDFGMVITNNSYGVTPSSCSDFGEYTLYSSILDQQAIDFPFLQHVFAAGNSGGTSIVCTNGLGTVLSGYQSSKNVITVGNTDVTSALYSASSKGPVKDGRIKPEIVTQGTSVYSTMPNDNYAPGIGTSMASAATSGGLALLYQRYRDQNSQSNPKNGLIKALLCNGATDKGQIGPDFTYGFGWTNLLRSLKMIDNKSYFNETVSPNATKTHSITVPANTAQLKVMLYWNDPAPSSFSGKTLVNDLDLTVTRSGGSAVLPRVVNSDTQATGVDSQNNMEQVVIDNPVAGTYSLAVKGKTIPQGTQEYFVVYDTIAVSTTLTYPIGNERLVKDDVVYVSWDSYGSSQNAFKVEFSANNGADWTDINSSVSPGLRQASWTVPDVITDQAKVRVSQGSVVRESQVFTILGSPNMKLSDTQCEGYIALDWPSVPGATDYEVLLLQGDEMKPYAVTTANNYSIGGLYSDSTYYVSVRARLNGNPGRQAVAKSRMPNSGNCQGSISDNDLRIESIVSPSGSGRKFTSGELSANSQITIRIKNLDDVVSNQQIEVGYSIGPDGSTVNSQLISPTIQPGGTVDHTFNVTADLSAVGSYRIKVFVNKPQDPITENNSMVRVFKQMDNPSVSVPFLDQVESIAVQEISADQTGLNGGDRYDFVNSAANGRLRTFVNTGMAYSGTKAFTLDVNRYDAAGNTNFLIGTFNLSSYTSSDTDIRLTFRYKNHGQSSNDNNKVWIRGSDSSPWIQAYDLYVNQNSSSDGYKLTGSIELSNLLKANGQTFSPSFQIKWGQWGDMITSDPSNACGYSFDDIRLFTETNDVQMLSIDTPATVSCGLSNAEQIKVTVRNNASSTLSNIPVKMQIDNGSVVTKTISSIASGASLQYTFTQTVDLSSIGSHTIKAWVEMNGDGSAGNNSKEMSFYNSLVISSFPYLQNFETNNGSWRSDGTNSSWAYGTPASSKINRAASGTKAWKTSLAGNYNNQEKSYLYSPCFSMAGLVNPTLSFSVAMDLDDCPTETCDIVYVEYSTNGNAWFRLGAMGQGTNWYDETSDNADAWSIKDYTRWHVSTIAIPTGFPNMRFRFVLQSDNATVREGIALDDIHIYDLQNNIFSGAGSSQIVTKSGVSGSGWVNFTDNNKILVSIMPNNNNLGNTSVQANVNTASVRSYSNQYYLDRNFTVKPQNNNFSTDMTVRLYFQDSESEKLIGATGCQSCTTPPVAYDLAISKFSTGDASLEDASLANDTRDGWAFFPSADVVKVPYDNGYYAEFKTKSFSEFWLAKDAIVTVSSPLPVELVSFTAKKRTGADIPEDVLLEWVTSSEKNFSRFEVELALTEEELRQNRFFKIGTVTGKSESASLLKYNFADPSTIESAVRYYRLKMIDLDETFAYSAVRAVVFAHAEAWRVYPNPSGGIFNLEVQAGQKQRTLVNVYDPSGKLLKKLSASSNDQIQKMKIDLSSYNFSQGLYFLEVINGEDKQIFKVIRE
jgi:hypothetical protein